MPLEDFDLKEILGKGSFGKVVKSIRRSDGVIYAMKLIKLQKLKQKDKINALNQIRFLASIEHPFVVEYKEAFYDEKSENLCIVMQYANKGDLQSKIKKNILNKNRIDEEQIWMLCYQILQGLNKLHDCNIIHRDVKPANIFFHDTIAKIGDLNVAKHLKDQFTLTQTGTPYYASPQVWNQKPYDFKSDIWSLGCVLYEMAMLVPPFRADTPEKLYKKIMLGEYVKVSKYYSKQLNQMISRLMTPNPKLRPSIKQLLCDPKMLQLKIGINEQILKEENLLQTINFPTNLKNLNKKLPNSKYEYKAKTNKKIEDKQVSSKIINIPSMKIINPQKSIKKIDFSIKDLLVARKPKQMNKNGSQKLIF